MCIGVSILTPKAFSMRRTMSPDRAALLLSSWTGLGGRLEALPLPPSR